MSNLHTYSDVMAAVNVLINNNNTIVTGMTQVMQEQDQPEHNKDLARMIWDLALIHRATLYEISHAVAALAMKNSAEPFDKIVEALKK